MPEQPQPDRPTIRKGRGAIRRLLVRVFYLLAAVCVLLCVYLLLTDFQGSGWPLTGFGAIISFIVGNSIAYSGPRTHEPEDKHPA